MHVRFALNVKFHKNWYTFQFWGQISRIFNFGSRSSIPINIFIISMFDFSAKFYKDQAHCNFETKTAQVFNFRSRSTISNITFTINEPDLLWVPLFHSIRNIFQFWNHIFLQWRDWSLCFNVECVLLGRNCDFLGSCLVVTAFYLVVTAGYCLLPGGYWWLLLVTARSHF